MSAHPTPSQSAEESAEVAAARDYIATPQRAGSTDTHAAFPVPQPWRGALLMRVRMVDYRTNDKIHSGRIKERSPVRAWIGAKKVGMVEAESRGSPGGELGVVFV